MLKRQSWPVTQSLQWSSRVKAALPINIALLY
jgi:hypothetical protein